MAEVGDIYWLDTPLPGEQSGGHHMSVVVSANDYNQQHSYPVLAALRDKTPNKYRILVTPAEFAPSANGVPLDQHRIVGLDQCSSVLSSSLGERCGTVSPEITDRVREAVPRQFQLEGPWARRGEAWEIEKGMAECGSVVLIMNDSAIRHPHQQQYSALPFAGDQVLPAPLLMIGKSHLLKKLGQLSEAQQLSLSVLLRFMFGLARL